MGSVYAGAAFTEGWKNPFAIGPEFLAVIYHEAENNAYSTICTGYRNRLQKGHVFGKPDENQIALDSYEVAMTREHFEET